MPTIYVNALEIKFLTEEGKEFFKKVTGTEVKGKEFLDVEKIFPYPPEVQSLTEKDAWETVMWGCSGFGSDTAGMTEEKKTLAYVFDTVSHAPVDFLRVLYFYFPIEKLRLDYDSEDKTLYLQEDGTLCKKKNCSHDDCEWSFINFSIELQWNHLPHPVFEVDKMIRFIKEKFPSFSNEEVGRLYHRFIVLETVFPQISVSLSPFIEAKIAFEKQLETCGNEYLKLLGSLNGYGAPQSFLSVRGKEEKAYRELARLYSQNHIRPKQDDSRIKS